MTAKRRTGTREWSEHSANLFLGCEHDCRYCYARCSALRFGRIRSAEEWKKPMSLHHVPRFARKVQGVIMFPTTHDITEDNLLESAGYLESILRPGNDVLIVTKPHPDCVEYLCRRLEPWRRQVEWRMTITARDDALLKYWEPGAPTYGDRCDALSEASVSVEPMLDPKDLDGLLKDLLPAVSGTIWIGKMNHVRQRVKTTTSKDRRQVQRIGEQQTDAKIMEIVGRFKGVRQIRWKDSIQEVMERCGMSL